MRRAVWTLLSLSFVVLISMPQALAAKRVALVIGIDTYDNLPSLQKAVNDEQAVAAALAGLGFEVITGENLTRREMNAKLAELDAAIEPGDTVFFAGHGLALGAENYLLPSDLPKPRDGEENLVRDEGHSIDAIVRRVQGRGAATSFFVLDACRDNPLAAVGTRSIGTSRGLTRVDTPKGVFVLFSAGLGQTALDRLSDDDPDANSIFTRKLVPLLKTPGLTHTALAKRVQQQVDALAATVRHPQQPAYYDQIIGEIELSPAASQASTPAAPQEAPTLAHGETVDVALAPPPAPVPPSAPVARMPSLPPPLVVEYRGQFGANRITGRFERLDATAWLEVNHESEPNRDNRFSFAETSRKGGIIELFDDTRSMWIRLDLKARHIFWSNNGKKSWNYIYEVSAAK
jgi:hypothetical protein